jgi:hypothetical protein
MSSINEVLYFPVREICVRAEKGNRLQCVQVGARHPQAAHLLVGGFTVLGEGGCVKLGRAPLASERATTRRSLVRRPPNNKPL